VDYSSNNLSRSDKSDANLVPPLSPEIRPLDIKDKTEEKVVQAVPVSEQALPSPSSDSTESHPSDTRTIPPDPPEPATIVDAGSEGKEEESAEHDENGGAFNPVTGEINWDCPCLGGMAHGPCGPEFKEAFSCFVFSEDEPKGINCVERFQAMQNCFREHPDVYADGEC
jgi:mitochondrial intermembrane space import and assembly protein 40